MSYHQFPAWVQDCAFDWQQRPLESDWSIGAPVAKKHSTSPHWATKGSLTAVLKPGPFVLHDFLADDHAEFAELTDVFDDSARRFVTNMPIAAIEKIAADLAYIGGFPVPPVALYKNPDLDETQPHHFACLSLKPFEGEAVSGKSSLKHLEGTALTDFIRSLSAMAVFKGWLNNTDANLHNVVVEKTSNIAAFPDFSMSSLYHWKSGRSMRTQHIASEDVVSRVDVREALGIIKDISNPEIRAVVENIPDEFLPEPDKAMMIKGLEYRRDHLGDLLLKSDLAISGSTAEHAAGMLLQRRQRLQAAATYDGP